MIPVTRLNHAVLYVRDAQASADFYQAAFDFEVVEQMGRARCSCGRATADNHHDLGLFSVGADAAPARSSGRVGLYHLAWEVPTIDGARRRAHAPRASSARSSARATTA